MNIVPFGDQILVRPVARKQVLVADTGTLSEYGEVVAVGEDVKKIKVGDKIGFSVFGIENLDIEGEKHFFIRESPEFLLCVIHDIP
jgi:co-chaperonin GroES (HSP10)